MLPPIDYEHGLSDPIPANSQGWVYYETGDELLLPGINKPPPLFCFNVIDYKAFNNFP
jgi:hypothetical protein